MQCPHALYRAALPAASALAVAIAASPVSPRPAWPCPHGQLWRVHLRQCVDLHSKLALAFEHMTPRRDPSPASPDPPSPTARPFPLPDLDAPTGAPAFVLPALDRFNP
jgi:hypothetical protein